MNSNKSMSMKLFIMILMLLNAATPSTPPTEAKTADNTVDTKSEDAHKGEVKPKSCNHILIQSIGFEGFDKPEKMALTMCPLVNFSCCTIADQLNIYANWKQGLEEDHLHDIIEKQQTVYNNLLSLSEQAYERAKLTADILKTKETSNCKVLARRVMHFQIKDIGPKLKDALINLYEFIFESHKGFYCSICDATLNSFINVNKKRFVLSEKFCRDITHNSLHVLLYFHVHFTKYLNLVTRFVTSCSVKGVYKENNNESTPKFNVSLNTFKELNSCKKYRNDETWFDACEPICRNFQVTKYSNYFAPNVKKFLKYNRFLAKQLNRLKKEQDLIDIIEGKKQKIRRARILSNESLKIDEKNVVDEGAEELDALISDALMFKENPIIIRSALGASVDLDNFESQYELQGIDLYKVGKSSEITDILYKSLKDNNDDKKEKVEDTKNKGTAKPDANDASYCRIHAVIAAVVLLLIIK